MLFDSRKEAALASSVIDQHIFFTTPYSWLWARAHNWEKGRVENGVGYVKKNLLNGLELSEFSAINPAARLWLDTIANVRIHGETHQDRKSVV